MATSTVSTIALTPPARHKEFLANEALSPGHIMELLSTGKVQLNDKIARKIPKLIALEKEYDGKGITDAYAQNDQTIVGVFRAGDEVTLRLPASAAAVVIGDYLEPFTGGVVRKVAGPLTDNSGGTANTTLQDIGSSFTEAEVANNFADVAAAINVTGAFAMALEAVDNSGGSAEVFIRAILL